MVDLPEPVQVDSSSYPRYKKCTVCYISRNNFDALIGESSEALAKEAFQRMDVQLDLSMCTAGILEGWSLTDYQSEYKEILQTLSTGLEPRVIDGHQWYKNNQYLFYKDRIVVPGARLDGSYSGPISVLVTLARIPQWTASVSVSTLV